ncbi:MAG TPA: UDP-3-O-(3-hydroxymyristoyl)glucosamine N-acyltransferase [Bacteroidia bacterium]|nr:UDP-3-O-(3-hydroxymyristoyl)glucosamine N-acyltransferase [Bacteroidia bacterium]HNT80419.1 UDP-3-O-(3-hydroxymyristoyl)glucosamine N-acyltransferase [Bacteroidia bacterium]
MKFKIKDIAQILSGVVEGDGEEEVKSLEKIEEAGKGSISFLANPKYTPYIYTTGASAVIVNKSFVAEEKVNCTLIRVDDAYKAFTILLSYYDKIRKDKKGKEPQVFIHETAIVDDSCYIGSFSYIGANSKIGKGSKIYPNCYIGENVVIGENTTLYSGVQIYSDCIIGSDCTFHSSVIIGADGFGFAPNSTEYQKVPQIGNVVIEDKVEIGAGSTIDRATLGSTIIRRGVKLDNLIQIAHNVEIGENTVIAAQTGVAGSTKIGKNCLIGGQVGIVGHIQIADEVKIAAQSGIGSSIVNKGEIVQGSPAFGIGDYKKSYVLFRKLPQLDKRISDLEKK